jgi:hypothetical protein
MFSLTFVLDWGGCLIPHPSHFVPQKTQYPLYRRLGGPRGWSGWVQKISPSPGFDPWTDQSIASHYTNSTFPAHSTLIIYLILIPCISMGGNVTVVMFLVHYHLEKFLTLILLTWRMWWAPNNASRWQMGFNLAIKELIFSVIIFVDLFLDMWLPVLYRHF